MRHTFTLLGSGTSTGVPLPGCQCAVCTSGKERNFRDRTSGIIHHASGRSILVDAGPDLRHQCLRHKVRRIDAVIYTHAHADHIYGTDDLRSYNFVSGSRIDCYASSETLGGLRRAFPYIIAPDPSYRGGQVAKLDLIEISNEAPFTVFDSEVHPFPLPHGQMTVTGFRIGELGYATDCKGLTPRAAAVLRGVKYLFLDGLRWETHNTHNSIGEAIAIAAELEAEQTYLVHTTHTIDYDETSAQLPPGVALGYDGLTLEFSDR
jgi:phosphoribosyl 1,2-cyclic phosphate phosphodiesterase